MLEAETIEPGMVFHFERAILEGAQTARWVGGEEAIDQRSRHRLTNRGVVVVLLRMRDRVRGRDSDLDKDEG